MSLSMHDLAVPLYVRILESLKGVLDKAVAHAKASGYDEAVLLEARLYPDMWSLRQQVAGATSFAVRGIARLAGVPVPAISEALDTFPDLHRRIDETLAFIRSADKAAIDAGPSRALTVPWGSEQKAMTGLAYYQALALPNFFFHATTAYDILRHNGVPVAKVDFTGPF
jgi:hypothetical protein